MSAKWLLNLLAISLAAFGMAAHAQSYPDRPVKLIVPWAPGGNVDIIARLVAQELGSELHQSFVVENQPGASDTLGEHRVAEAAPDGYTLLFNSVTHVIVPSILAHVPNDPLKDFVAVGQTDSIPFVFVANAKEPFSTVDQFVKWARTQPAPVNYASAGIGSSNHLAGALFAKQSGLNLKNVPYKGSGPAQLDVFSGLIPVMFDSAVGIYSGVHAGKLKPIAIAAKARLPQLPDVPTFAEAGYPAMIVSTWHGIYAPAGTPPAVVHRLNQALNRISAHPEIASKLNAMGAQITRSTPDSFAAYNRDEYQRWKVLIKNIGITSI